MKKPILIISDKVYSLPNSKVSLVNLIKHNCDDISDYTFRSINCSSVDDISIQLSNKLEGLSTLSSNNKGTAYVLCGLNECNGGYNVPIYSTIVSSIAMELNNVNYDVVFINITIDHGLPGKIGGWHKRSSSVIDECCNKNYTFQINPSIYVKIYEDNVTIPIESSRIIVKSICEDIKNRGS